MRCGGLESCTGFMTGTQYWSTRSLSHYGNIPMPDASDISGFYVGFSGTFDLCRTSCMF